MKRLGLIEDIPAKTGRSKKILRLTDQGHRVFENRYRPYTYRSGEEQGIIRVHLRSNVEPIDIAKSRFHLS